MRRSVWESRAGGWGWKAGIRFGQFLFLQLKLFLRGETCLGGSGTGILLAGGLKHPHPNFGRSKKSTDREQMPRLSPSFMNTSRRFARTDNGLISTWQHLVLWGIFKTTNSTTTKPTKQPTNQPTNQSTNKPTNKQLSTNSFVFSVGRRPGSSFLILKRERLRRSGAQLDGAKWVHNPSLALW